MLMKHEELKQYFKKERHNRKYRNVQDHNELAKTYMKDHMSKHFKSVLDKSTDASAILAILCWCEHFSRNKSHSIAVRDQVRNEWGHGKMHQWNEMKYLDSFKKMISLVESFPNALKNKQQIKDELLDWQNNGLKIMGNNVDPILLKKIFDETSSVMSKLDHYEEINKENFQLLKNDIENAVLKYKELEGRVSNIESGNSDLREILDDHETRVSNLESSVNQSSKISFEPPNRQNLFTGRSEQLKLLQKGLIDTKQANRKMAISGLGGIGKTSLALEFSWVHRDAFPGGIYWITADTDNSKTLDTSIFGFANKIGIGKNDSSLHLTIFTDYLRTQEHCLVIIDNVDDCTFSNQIKELTDGAWIRNSKASILMTTRIDEVHLGEILPTSYKFLTLDVFTPEESVTFLCKRSGRKLNKDDNIDANNIVHELGCLPLALDQAGAYLRICKRTKLSSYLKKLKEQKIKLLTEKGAQPPHSQVDIQRVSVATTWMINLEAIVSKHPVASKVMRIFSYLSPNGISLEILNLDDQKEVSDDELFEMMNDDIVKNDMILKMTEMSLFDDKMDDKIKVHRLVQDIIRKEMKENAEEHENILNLIPKLLSNALMMCETPDSLDDMIKNDSNTSIASLAQWNLTMENVGHFLEELKSEKLLTHEIFFNSSFVMLLDHSSLFYFIQNQTERSNAYTQIMLDIMAKIGIGYTPKFKLPIQAQEKEKMLNMIEPITMEKSEDKSITCDDAKEEGNAFFKKGKYSHAIEIYNVALSLPSNEEIQRKIQLNICQSLFRLKRPKDCIKRAELILSQSENDPLAFLWICLSYRRLTHMDKSSIYQEEKNGLYKILQKAYAFLSLYFAELGSTRNKISEILNKKDIIIQAIKAHIVKDERELLVACMSSSMIQRPEKWTLLYLTSPKYDIKSEILCRFLWSKNVMYLGSSFVRPSLNIDMVGPANIPFSNCFINLTIKMIHTGLHIGSTLTLFKNCTISSWAPTNTSDPQREKELMVQEMMDRLLNMKDTVETEEQKSLRY